MRQNIKAGHRKSLLKPNKTSFALGMDKALEAIYAFLSNPALAVILALVLGLLSVTGVVDKTAASCAAVAWVIAFVWIARAGWMRRTAIVKRLLLLAVFGLIFAVPLKVLFTWSVSQYHAQRSGHLHILTLTPLDLVAGKAAEMNIFYENTGDEPVDFVGDTETLLLSNLSAHSESSYLEDEENTAHKLLIEGEQQHPLASLKQNNLSAHSNAWNTLRGPILDQVTIDDLKTGNALLLTVSINHYFNSNRIPEVFCARWGRDRGVVQTCGKHPWNRPVGSN